MATKDETRQAILQAAQQLFARFGPIKTSVADIARELGMSPANIYNFFPSRDAILEAVGELQLATLKHRIQREIERSDDGWPKIEALFVGTLRHVRDHLENEKDILQLQAIAKNNDWKFVLDYYNFVLSTAESVLRNGIEDGSLRFDRDGLPEMTVTQAAAALFDCLLAALDPLMMRKFDRTNHEVRVRAQLALLHRAFA